MFLSLSKKERMDNNKNHYHVLNQREQRGENRYKYKGRKERKMCVKVKSHSFAHFLGTYHVPGTEIKWG